MSGFAGLIGPVGASIDPPLVESLAASVAYCGPDRQNRWQEGAVALVHALLRTTFEESGDRQPVSFDGEVRLVADARVDGRDELVNRLRAAGREVLSGSPDSELILHAYHAWGEACVERLIGDFAFAIWDGRERKLFCARDQFGTVPFYYATVDESLIFGDTVEALLVHPRLDRTLNRATVGDYLLFGYSNNPEAGFYQHIHRLPAAHCLIHREGELRVRRYWTPPEPCPRAPHESDQDTVERFGQVLREAVKDRLRSGKIASTLSGGMDSTLVTGLALRHAPVDVRIDAYTSGCDWLLPDNERYWAHLCAHHLGVPFHSVSVEGNLLNPADGNYWRYPPEPRFWLRRLPNEALFKRVVADGARVLLMGMGGDALVAGGHTQWSEMMARGQFVSLLPQIWRYCRYYRQRPPIRGAWRRRSRALNPRPLISPLDPGFAAEQNLEERWRELCLSSFTDDPRRGMTNNPFWSEMFCGFDPESLRLPLKVRQPFFDVRLLEEAMRLPLAPWQFGKAILRRVGKGMLPEEILTRPKTPYSGSVYWEAARRGYEPWLKELGNTTELDGFVDRQRLAQYAGDVEKLGRNAYFQGIMFPAGLAAWLRMAKI
jgi:asparagine synthase (glutamine-hydrolysing)